MHSVAIRRDAVPRLAAGWLLASSVSVPTHDFHEWFFFPPRPKLNIESPTTDYSVPDEN